jgi:hypothetical protein
MCYMYVKFFIINTVKFKYLLTKGPKFRNGFQNIDFELQLPCLGPLKIDDFRRFIRLQSPNQPLFLRGEVKLAHVLNHNFYLLFVPISKF